jgi:hypothetical protein
MYSGRAPMAGRTHIHRRRPWRRIPIAVLVVTGALGVLSLGPVPGVAAQGDQPAVDQYTDPFAPLATGRRAPAWNPFSRDFAARVPAPLRRRLARLDDGAALEMLLAQLGTERVRTGAGPPVSRSDRPSARASREGRAEDPRPGALSAAVRSISDGGGPHGLLLTAGVLAVTAGGLAAAWMRPRPPRGAHTQSASYKCAASWSEAAPNERAALGWVRLGARWIRAALHGPATRATQPRGPCISWFSATAIGRILKAGGAGRICGSSRGAGWNGATGCPFSRARIEVHRLARSSRVV